MDPLTTNNAIHRDLLSLSGMLYLVFSDSPAGLTGREIAN